MLKGPDKKRRNALIAGVRYTSMAALGALGYKMAVKTPGASGYSPKRCISEGICSKCGVYNNCVLPQALSRKKVLSAINKSKQK